MIFTSATIAGIAWSALASVRFEPSCPVPSVNYLGDFQVYMFGRVMPAPLPVPDKVLAALADEATFRFLDMSAAEFEGQAEGGVFGD